MLLYILALLLLLLDIQPLCWSKRQSRPGILQASRLIVEVAKIAGCPKEPGNVISYFNFQTRMISKTDTSIDVDYNISRSVNSVNTVMIQLTRCRESVSYNSCERYQNWRFENNPCKGFDDPSAIWNFVIMKTHPHLTCPFKEGTYRVRNITNSARTGALLAKIPLPWEGNVWIARFSMLDSKSGTNICTDMELHFQRVRDN